MKFLRFTLLLLIVMSFCNAQNTERALSLDYYLPQDISYNTDISKPQEIIGYVPGKWHVTHDQLVSYMTVLAAQSNRISIENRGVTFEDRPLILLTISAPENHDRIDEIKTNHRAITENDQIQIENQPLVVYQGFSIHGNEASGSNAALLLAYYLAAAQGTEIDDLLKNTVILFDPAFNPDGLQRFAGWVNQHKNKNLTSISDDREYNEAWPGGRTNHYWFDMNRDWLPAQLPESRARIASFHEWYPNILTDHHEMGTNATFFFQPGIPSRTHPLTPPLNQQLTKEIGEFHAAQLNKIGSLYYTEESYDDFYYGKGSTFPDINGSIGILFEQASSRGHSQESDNGTLTFPFTIRNQFNAGLSTLKAGVSMRKKLLTYQQNFYSKAKSEAPNDAIIFGDATDSYRTKALAEVLLRHQIQIKALKEDFIKNGVTYKKGHAFIVPKNQKNARLINAMFERRTQFKDSLFYDISAWTFPLAFNLDYDTKVNSNLGDELPFVAQNDQEIQIGIESIIEPASLKKSSYAYLLPWNEYLTPKVLYQLLDKNIRVKVGMSPFKIEGNSFDYGTLLIPVQNQSMDTSELHTFLNKLQSANEVRFTGVSTGLTTGIDLGSRQFRNIKKPEIALLIGDGISPYDAGEIWHLLDQRYDIAITKIDINNINRTDLSKFNTIIVPSTYGSPENEVVDQLKEWTRNGGTLIAYRNSLRWLKNQKLLPIEFKTSKIKATNLSFKDRSNFYGAQNIGGAIFNSHLDRSHPIAFGYKNNPLPLFRNTSIFIKPAEESFKNPIKYTDAPLLSGYISEEKLALLKGSVPFVHRNYGKGDIIGFTDNTQFRAFWYGTNKLLMNAIYFSKEM